MKLKVLLLVLPLPFVCDSLFAQQKDEKRMEKVENYIRYNNNNFKSQKSNEMLKHYEESKKDAVAPKSSTIDNAILNYKTTEAVSDIGAAPLSDTQIKDQAMKMMKSAESKMQVSPEAILEKKQFIPKAVHPDQLFEPQAVHPDLDLEPVAKRKDRVTGQSRFDSRIEVRQLNPLVDWQNAILTNAASVGLIIKKQDLLKIKDSLYKISVNVTLAKKFNLCASEPFGSQPVAGNGTGMLIGDQEILTAGHVFEGPVADYVLVFGFEMENVGGIYESFISADNVYGFKKLLHLNADLDIAHASLDRKCSRPALKLSANRDVRLNTEVYMVGFPSGLPQKVALNAGVYKNSDRHCFYTSLDAFQGNSGSPVFDRNTNEVIGILVSGNADYVWTGGCNINKTCELPFCDGEKVVRITEILTELE
jgi:S1-C subfamily serine protease